MSLTVAVILPPEDTVVAEAVTELGAGGGGGGGGGVVVTDSTVTGALAVISVSFAAKSRNSYCPGVLGAVNVRVALVRAVPGAVWDPFKNNQNPGTCVAAEPTGAMATQSCA